MKRPGPGVMAELAVLMTVLACLAGSLGLVLTMYRKADRWRAVEKRAPLATAAPKPLPPPPPEPEPVPKPPQVVQNPPTPKIQPPPPPAEDPTIKAVATLSVQESTERAAAALADRKAKALALARKDAEAELGRWKRREALVKGQIAGLGRQAFELEQQAEELALDRDELARERDAAKAALSKAVASGGGYAVLPHKSPDGTWQRPVVVECTNGLAVLQPYGLNFTMLDLSGLLGTRSNPFVAAVGRELIKIQTATAPDGEPVTPYIYFIVRPDGIRPYYEARARLEPLGIAFGYELVQQDWPIEFPDINTWDESGPPKPKTGDPGTGDLAGASGASRSKPASSPGSFVWPTERAAASGGTAPGTDPTLWPRRTTGPLASGNGTGTDEHAGAPDPSRGEGPGTPIWPRASSGNQGSGSNPFDDPTAPDTAPGTGTLKGDNFGNTGSLDPAPRPFPSIARGGTSRGSGDSHQTSPDRQPAGSTGLSQISPSTGTGVSVGRRPGGQPGSSAPHSGLTQLPPDALPGLEDSTQSTKMARSTKPANSAQPSEFASEPFNGSETFSAGKPGQPAGTRPGSAPGRVVIDKQLLAQAEADDLDENRPALPPQGLRQNRGPGNSSGGGSGPGGKPGAPGGAAPNEPNLGSRGTTGSSTPGRSVDVPLELVVACEPAGLVIHPGGYRLSLGSLKRDRKLRGDLETIVRNHELIDPLVRPRPKLRFLVEPGGSEAYWEAKRQTVFSGVGWPETTQVAETSLPSVFRKETF